MLFNSGEMEREGIGFVVGAWNQERLRFNGCRDRESEKLNLCA